MTLATLPAYDPNDVEQREGQAVVIGAGFAGLCAARVLADCFPRVLILERDSLPDGPRQRRGIPQGPHAHILFTSGCTVLEDLLPGYGDDLIAAGAIEQDFGRDWTLYRNGGYRAEPSSRIPVYAASRPLFEHVLRRRVSALDPVELRSAHHVQEYVTAGSGSVVDGLRVRPDGGGEEIISAGIVVDATGRTSTTPLWLEKHGYTAPPKDEMNVDMTYCTGLIKRPPDDVRTIRIDDSGDIASAFAVEDDRWQGGVAVRGSDQPPADPEELERYATDMPVPDVADVMAEHEWCDTDIELYPFPSNRRYRYEELDEFPRDLVVIGDAIASFNPIYGQGMTVAVFESLVLHDLLTEPETSNLSLQFFQRVERIIDVPWFQALATDSRFPEGDAEPPAGVESYIEYMGQAVRTAHYDSQVAEAIMRVGQLEQPLSSLLRPAIFERVFDVGDEGFPDDRSVPDWVPASLREVGPLLEGHLGNPKQVAEWPSI